MAIDVNHNTRWTMVCEAGAGSKPALEELCRAYQPAVVRYVRQVGYADPEDLAQSFFVAILDSDFLSKADRDKGRFRDYLTTALDRFLKKHYRDAKRLKRGGGHERVAVDFATADESFPSVVAHEVTPERVLEQAWCHVLAARARTALGAEYERRNKRYKWEALKRYVREDPDPGDYAAVAKALELSESGVREAVKSMRQRYQDLLKHEVEDTTKTAADYREEWAALRGELLG